MTKNSLYLLLESDLGEKSMTYIDRWRFSRNHIKNELDNRAVKTNLTIPAWLKEMAEEEGVNYSKLFQAALIDYLGIPKGSR